MKVTLLAGVLASASFGLAGCATMPRDAGFQDVQRAVQEATQQPLEWDPRRPVKAPDDAEVTALLRQEPLTADRAVQIAFRNNRDLQATLEGLGVAQAELMAANTIRNPLFHGEFRLPGDPRKPFELGITQTIVDLFQVKNRRRLGRAQFESARARVSGALVNFSGQVRLDYYQLLAARKILARHETMMKAQEAAAELSRRQHTAGNITDLDLENEQSRYEEVKLAFARAQLDEIEAREQVTADLGLLGRAELTLPDEFPTPPEQEPSSQEIEAQLMTRRLDIQVAQREIEAAQRATGAARTAAFDDLELGAHLEQEPEGTRTTGPSVVVPIPLFDRGKAQRTGARAMLRQAQQRLAALTVTARSEARAARERLLEARSRMAYLRDVVVPRRTRILSLTQLEYNAMLRGVFQLIAARQNLATAQREEIIATRDYWAARTELDTAVFGVSGFSVRGEDREPRRLHEFAPMSQPAKEKE